MEADRQGREQNYQEVHTPRSWYEAEQVERQASGPERATAHTEDCFSPVSRSPQPFSAGLTDCKQANEHGQVKSKTPYTSEQADLYWFMTLYLPSARDGRG